MKFRTKRQQQKAEQQEQEWALLGRMRAAQIANAAMESAASLTEVAASLDKINANVERLTQLAVRWQALDNAERPARARGPLR